MTKRLAILLMMLPALSAAAQGFRLTPYKSPSALYLNVDRLYSYNRYEKSHLELGLQWVTPSETPRGCRVAQTGGLPSVYARLQHHVPCFALCGREGLSL